MHDRVKFQRAGGVHGSDFNAYDMPGAQYFRILFHFYGADEPSGLLHPTWVNFEQASNSGWVTQEKHPWRAHEYFPWRYNTAYSYLIMNDEQERAQYLRRFIELLSNINSESPWYFQSVKGIEEALNRKQMTEEFTFSSERGKLSIECMPDSADQRIGTLMDLYRALSRSWINKREILPANLRKFDMTVVVFQTPISQVHTPRPGIIHLPDILGMTSTLLEDDDDWATMEPDQYAHYVASYKMYEFHNCEFDYNSTISAGDSMSNMESFNTTYNIGIFYDDMYEIRYNEFMSQMNWSFQNSTDKYNIETNDAVKKTKNTQQVNSGSLTPDFEIQEIGDLVLIDTAAWQNWDSHSEPQGNPKLSDYKHIESEEIPEGGLLIDAVRQVTSMVSNKIDQKVNRLFLGNLFGLSIQRTAQQVAEALNGNVLGGINYAKTAIRGNYNGSTELKKPYDKLFDPEKEVQQETIELGNLFKTASTLSNI